MKFMVVDDSAFSVMMIRDILAHNGYNVVATAANKEEIPHASSMTPGIATEFGEATLNVGLTGSDRKWK